MEIQVLIFSGHPKMGAIHQIKRLKEPLLGALLQSKNLSPHQNFRLMIKMMLLSFDNEYYITFLKLLT